MHPSLQLASIGQEDIPDAVKTLKRAPIIERMVANIWQIFIMEPVDSGSLDLFKEPQFQY